MVQYTLLELKPLKVSSKKKTNKVQEKLADELLAKLRYDITEPKGIPLKDPNCHALIWNLFRGKYKFSYAMFEIIMKKITE